MDGGGCHGNWESVAARHHLLLLGAEQAHEYLSFMDTDRRTTRAAPDRETREGWRDEGKAESPSDGCFSVFSGEKKARNGNRVEEMKEGYKCKNINCINECRDDGQSK